MRRTKRIRLMIAGIGVAALVVIFLWLVSSPRFQPEARIAPPAGSPPIGTPPARPVDSMLINRDTGQPVAGVPATPDRTAVPGAADSILAADTLARLLPGPDTAIVPADVSRLVYPGKLIIPVEGIAPRQLLDTYTDARSEGRVHNAIDIIAPGGAPVLAATDGKIVKLFNSERGGITIYELDPNNRVVYYYAHLQGYADGLAEGEMVRQGDLIGYVGDTGNAGAGNYHLHFEISIVADPRQYWGGVPVNPYPILMGARGGNRG